MPAYHRVVSRPSLPAPPSPMHGSEGATTPSAGNGRTRRRLSRTLSRSRWDDYRALLEHALAAQYEIVSLETFITQGGIDADRILILRHDVDQAPRSVLPMLDIERRLGLNSTWYFRWRTATPAAVRAVQDAGGQVGLHYETMTRLALTRGVPRDDAEARARLHACRELLRAEIRVFRDRFGDIRSVAAHGDTRVPAVRNGDLLRDQDPRDFGVEFDSNDAMRRHELACWLTDRSEAEGGWKDGIDPAALFGAGSSPVLCLTHPNNWTSGLRLWVARIGITAHGARDRPDF